MFRKSTEKGSFEITEQQLYDQPMAIRKEWMDFRNRVNKVSRGEMIKRKDRSKKQLNKMRTIVKKKI